MYIYIYLHIYTFLNYTCTKLGNKNSDKKADKGKSYTVVLCWSSYPIRWRCSWQLGSMPCLSFSEFVSIIFSIHQNCDVYSESLNSWCICTNTSHRLCVKTLRKDLTPARWVLPVQGRDPTSWEVQPLTSQCLLLVEKKKFSSHFQSLAPLHMHILTLTLTHNLSLSHEFKLYQESDKKLSPLQTINISSLDHIYIYTVKLSCKCLNYLHRMYTSHSWVFFMWYCMSCYCGAYVVESVLWNVEYVGAPLLCSISAMVQKHVVLFAKEWQSYKQPIVCQRYI